MADINMDVDANVIIPVNILPLLDDTDFKTIETAIVYNSAGIAITWNFVTAAGVVSGVAITPTTGGNYDWSEPVTDKGMYAIAIPATGGASANNDTEGTGWITGVATGVLPWRGPTICFRRAALNDLFQDGGTASTNMEDFFDGTGYAGGTAKLTVNAVQLNGTGLTARDIGASVLLSSGTGTGQLDFTSGVVKANLAQILGTALTETAGQIAAAFKKFFDVATPTGTVDSIPDAAPGAAGGLFIAGTNAPVTITGSGAALSLVSTGGNGSGLVATGNGSGDGIIATGGATGHGAELIGGGTSGNGMYVRSQNGTGAGSYAARFMGGGSSDSGGIYASAVTDGDGIEGIAAGNRHGLYVVGAGTGEGLHATAGVAANGHGAHFEGVGANSSGLLLSRGGAGGDDLSFANNDVTVANVTTVATTTNLTNLPAITNNWLTAAGLAADAVTEIQSGLATATVLGTPAGASIAADIAAIEAQTDDIGTAGAGLTALGDTRLANLDAAITTRATPAQVNTEVVDALNVDTYAELSSVPAATSSLATKIRWLYMFARNKLTQTNTAGTLYADDGTTPVSTNTVSDDGTTTTRGEWS